MEFRLWPAADDEETVALVDLREMYRQRFNPLLSKPPVRGHRGLHDIHLAVAQEGIAALPGPKNTVSDLMARIAKEANADEEWCVESGVTRSHECEAHASSLVPHPLGVRPP
jgi:hypothetical protein